MKIKIITDTTAGLPPEFIEENGITVMPQMVIFGDKSYRDDSELDTRLFLEMLQNAPDPAPNFGAASWSVHSLLRTLPGWGIYDPGDCTFGRDERDGAQCDHRRPKLSWSGHSRL
jgi:hypothetical protein